MIPLSIRTSRIRIGMPSAGSGAGDGGAAAPPDAASGATGPAMLELSSVLDNPARWADAQTSPAIRSAR